MTPPAFSSAGVELVALVGWCEAKGSSLRGGGERARAGGFGAGGLSASVSSAD